jgi:hypothetical protein
VRRPSSTLATAAAILALGAGASAAQAADVTTASELSARWCWKTPVGTICF